MRIQAIDGSELNVISDNADYKLLFTFDERIEGHPLQGFDIFNGIAFQTYDGGYCSTFKLETGEKIADFRFGSFYSHNHCGNANFGLEYPEGNTTFPALYVSGDLTTKACYVENVTESSSELIQTIYFDVEPGDYTGGQVILDRDRKRIVYMQRKNRKIGDLDNIFKMWEFLIPALSAGREVHFTNADMLCEPYELPYYSPYYQGAMILGRQILQTHGYAENSFGSQVGIMVFDTLNHTFDRHVDLTGKIDFEPQGAAVHEGRLIMNFANGGMYEIMVEK